MIRRILITIVTVLIPILLQAQCWLSQSVSDLDNADLSSEFKTLLKSQQYNKAYQFLYSNAFNTRTDISVLKKLKNTYEDILFDLKNVNEDFIKSEIVHLDLGGHNRYPEAVKIITADVDYANKPIDNLLDGYIQYFTPKFKNNSVDRITIESAPASNDIIAEVKRITKDGGKIELEHPVSANLKYDDIANRAGGYINKTESFVKNGVEFKRVVIIKGQKNVSNLEASIINSLKRRVANSGINISDVEIDDIILNAKIIDEALAKLKDVDIETDKFLKTINDLVKSDKFENPQDLVKGLEELVKEKGKAKDYLDQLNEYEEGLFWMQSKNGGNNVVISKKFGANDDSELDVLLQTSRAIVECKRVSGGGEAIYDRMKDIVVKFSSPDPAKILPSIKKTHKKFIGQIKFDGGGIYKDLEQVDFIKKIKESGAIGDSNFFSLEELKIIEELHVINNKGRFIIYKSDWEL